jgi:alkylhydroperoxidase family enzyme
MFRIACHLQTTQEIHMPTYQIHTIASAPEKSKTALEQLQQAFGVIPNLVAVISNSPKLVTALVGVFQQVHSSSLTEPEIQIVLLTDAVANSSAYAVAFHTALALKQGVSSEETTRSARSLCRGTGDLAHFLPWRRRSSRSGGT